MWIQFPDWGLNLGPEHWELGVLATGPPGKSFGGTCLNHLCILEHLRHNALHTDTYSA